MQSSTYFDHITLITQSRLPAQSYMAGVLAELNHPFVWCSVDELLSAPIQSHRCLLLDYQDGSTIRRGLSPQSIPTTSCDIVIYNAPKRIRTEALLSLGRLRGIFYTDDTHSVIRQGLQRILCGQIVIPKTICHQLLNYYQEQYPAPINTGTALSPRESQVLRELLSGHSNLKIADRFCISEVTVKSHLHNIYRKLEVKNRLQAIAWAKRHLSTC